MYLPRYMPRVGLAVYEAAYSAYSVLAFTREREGLYIISGHLGLI